MKTPEDVTQDALRLALPYLYTLAETGAVTTEQITAVIRRVEDTLNPTEAALNPVDEPEGVQAQLDLVMRYGSR